jgi:hypothetical protein
VLIGSQMSHRRHRIALTASHQQHQTIIVHLPRLCRRHENAVRQIELPQAVRRFNVAQHAASEQRDLPPSVTRHINDDLDAVQRCRETTDDDAPGCLVKNVFKGRDDGALGLRAPRALGISRIGKQSEHALIAILRESPQIHRRPDDRSVVNLEITRMNNDADRRGNRDRCASGQAVRHVNPFDIELAEVDALARLDGMENSRIRKSMLDELVFEQRQREVCAVDRHVYFSK